MVLWPVIHRQASLRVLLYHLAVIHRATMAFGILLAVLATGPGCARQAESTSSHDDTASPVVHGARAGLEMRIWVLRDGAAGVTGGQTRPLGETLGPYFAAGGAFSRGDQERWAANGLRLVSVPLERLGDVQEALGSPGAIQRQWLGEHPDWMELVRGPQSARQVVRLESGLMTLEPGRLRLLGRCWVSPALPRAGADPLAEVRVDLALQHQGLARPRSLRELVDRPQRTRIEHEGVVFSRFVLELGLGADEALLIVPERPEADWGDDPDAPAATGSASPDAITGPPAPRLPTLGDAMLWSDAGAGPGSGPGAVQGAAGGAPRPVRVIIALIPRLPEKLELAAAPRAR